MKVRKKLVFTLLPLVLLMFSCAPVYYPPQVNVPMLKEQGEGKVNISGSSDGGSLLGSYAISDQLAVSGGLNFFSYEDNQSVKVNEVAKTYRGAQLDLAIGYFKPFNTHGLFDVYVGIGHAELDSEVIKGSVKKVSLQSSIGYKSEEVEFSFATRLVDIRADKHVVLTESQRDMESVLIEPVITYKVGWEKFKITSQLGLSIPLRNNYQADLLRNYPVIFNLGLEYRFFSK